MTGPVLLLAACLSLPAVAGSDRDFAAQFSRANAEFSRRARLIKTTQESGPKDPLLLAQKPLLDLIKKVEGSVVYLTIMVPNPKGVGAPVPEICTGFFVDSLNDAGRAGLIATNAHCVEKAGVGAKVEIGLQGPGGYPLKTAEGRVLACGDSESSKDVAFVELLDQRLNRRPLPLWTKLDRGEQVVAIGHPHGLEFSVTRGIVSGLGRTHLNGQLVIEMTQSDASINPGNSGGPLFNMWGSVVGMNTLLASNSGGFEGVSFSIPAGYLTMAMRQYRRTGNLTAGLLETHVAASKATNALTAISVFDGGPADVAGMRDGDEIIGVDGLDLIGADPQSALKVFTTQIRYRSPGETLALVIRRDGKTMLLTVTIGGPMPKPTKPAGAPLPPKKTGLSPTGLTL